MRHPAIDLPALDTGPLALVRLDGDMYELTIQGLEALCARLSPGGFLIVDDLAIQSCAQAVSDYRAAYGIAAGLHRVDWTGGWWRTP